MKIKGEIISFFAESMGTELSSFSQGNRKRNIKYSKEGTIIWTQKLVQCGVTSVNGITFDKHKFEIALQDPLLQTKMKENRLYGEADHPPKDNYEEFLKIHIGNITHRINKLWFEGDALYGEMETLNTDKGRNMRGLIEQNAVICMSFRGYNIKDGYGIITFDWVSDPSCLSAKSVEGSFNERIYAESHNIAQDKALHHAIDTNLLTIAKVDSSSIMISENESRSVDGVIKSGNEVIGIIVESEESKRNTAISHYISSALF